MKAIIMAGGEGSRLRPLTCDRPKPLMPVANKPVMEYAIELLRLYGIREIGVTLQYLPESIVDYFGDGSNWDVNLHYFVEETPLGTAGSVKNAEKFLDETFIVISGDALTDFNLAQGLDFHRQRQALATLVLTTVDDPLEYGVVITDDQGRIIKFLEKPGWGEVFSDQVNTGIYVLEPEVLSLIPAGKKFDFSKDLFPEILRRQLPLFASVAEGYWCDIGNLEQYMGAHQAILADQVKVTPNAMYQGKGIWLGLGVKIDPTVRLEGPLLIGDYCRIGPGVELGPYTVLGNNVQVKAEASLKKTIVWDGAYIGGHSQLRGAVLCHRVTLERGVSIFEGAVVGDLTKIEEGSVVKPGVKLWPHKRLEKGTIQHHSIIWGRGGRKNLFGSRGIPGPFNQEITPEVAARLGAAYGSTFALHQKIGISCDGQRGAQMLKNAFIAGLLSAGVQATDFGNISFPALRYGIDALGLRGGVHLTLDGEQTTKVWFRFVNNQGILFSRDEERKLENIFIREDVRRVGMDEMGLTYPIFNLEEIYSDHLLDQVQNKDLPTRGLRVVVHVPGPSPLTNLIPTILQRLGVQVVGLIGGLGDKHGEGAAIPTALSALAEEVIRQGADLGAWFEPDGEQLFLVDEQGQIVDENLYLLLMALIIFQSNPGAKVAVPITAPQGMEVLAEKFGGQVMRTKTRTSQLMEMVADADFRRQQGRFPQIALQFDATLALLKILDFMAGEKQKLSGLLALVPAYYMDVQSTPCPWELKGQVMRKLIEEHGQAEVELVDGIKIYQDRGWALVLPDTDEPVYKVYSEGFSQEAAAELTAFYVERIQNLLQGQQQTTHFH